MYSNFAYSLRPALLVFGWMCQKYPAQLVICIVLQKPVHTIPRSPAKHFQFGFAAASQRGTFSLAGLSHVVAGTLEVRRPASQVRSIGASVK